MSKAEVLKALHSLTLEEMLEVIEVASRLLRQLILRSQPIPETPTASAPHRIPGQNKGQVAAPLTEAVVQMQPLYEAHSELTQWTDEDPEDIQDYADYA